LGEKSPVRSVERVDSKWKARLSEGSLSSSITVAIISTGSHLALAATVARGIAAKAHHWAIELVLVGASGAEARVLQRRMATCFRVRAHEEFVNPVEFAELRRRYSLAEICFLLKPRVLRRILDEGSDVALYFDSDVDIFSALDVVVDALRKSAIVLTPHITEPLPEDQHLPRDITILRAGAFNLGFVGVSNDPEALRFLDWWAAREARYGYVDPYRAWGADQKWCDLVPALFDRVAILKNPGLNVGYWNLPSRPLSKKDGKWYAGGEPLVFFHFSGFDPDRPHILSKFQDRIDPAKDPLLTELLEDYAARLKDAQRDLLPFLAQMPDDVPTIPPPNVDDYVVDALAPEQYAVTVAVRPTRLVVEPGEVALVQVVISNPGCTPLWIARHSDGVHGIGLSFHLSRANGEMLAWDNPRQYFAEAVPARGSSAFEFRYRVPLDPGQFVVEIDLVHEGHGWFKEKGGRSAALEVFAGVHGGAR
jgi:hypothetical protein